MRSISLHIMPLVFNGLGVDIHICAYINCLDKSNYKKPGGHCHTSPWFNKPSIVTKKNCQLFISSLLTLTITLKKYYHPRLEGIGLWELCSKFLSLFYSKFLLKYLHYVHLYSFYAYDFIIILHLQVNY